MIVKVCGMRSSANIREVELLPIDWMGFIFYPPSPRYCTTPPSPLPSRQRRIGVFVNADDAFMEERIRLWHLDMLQLHGDESPARCSAVRQHFGLPVIKAFGIGSPTDFTVTTAYEGHADYFLFDTLSDSRGGSGKSFCHEWLGNYTGLTPFLLSGGIGIKNIHELRTIHHPKWVGIDLNSRFETAPALKSPILLGSFIQSLFTKSTTSMNKIDTLFQTKGHNLLDIYFCAGYPHLDSTIPTLLALQEQGIDMVEIGIPFSDPMADGPVIQTAATQALRNGMTLQLLFDQLKVAHGQIHIPVLLMGYLNVIYQYGFRHFCESCRDCGIDGVIIPDLPFDIYMKEYKETAEQYGIHVIMLITPETSEQRIRLIDAHTHGFIYQVSTDATTGVQHTYEEGTIAYFRRVRDMHLQHPTLIGFGISNPATFSAACEYAAGGIVGSLFVQLSSRCNTPREAVSTLLDTLGHHPDR